MKTIANPKPRPTSLLDRHKLAAMAGCSLPTLEVFLAGGQPGQARTARAYDRLAAAGYVTPRMTVPA